MKEVVFLPRLTYFILATAVYLPSALCCSDSTTYFFQNIQNGVVVLRQCGWLTARADIADFRTAKFCPITSNGSVVQDECPLSCGLCPTQEPSSTTFPSSVPSPLSSIVPSASPSATPSTSPSYLPSSLPSAQPTIPASSEPTSSPSDGALVCQDSDVYTFENISNGKVVQRYCSWLTARADIADFRIAKFCPQSSNGSVVQDECPLSCDTCPTKEPSSALSSTLSPSSMPSISPSVTPSTSPSYLPSSPPSAQPTSSPSDGALVCQDSDVYTF